MAARRSKTKHRERGFILLNILQVTHLSVRESLLSASLNEEVGGFYIAHAECVENYQKKRQVETSG